MMNQPSVSQFLADAQQNEALRKRLRAAMSIQSCVEVAESYGYLLSSEELQSELDQMSEEELAELINPGVAPRQHIKPH